MKKVTVQASKTYDIVIGQDILAEQLYPLQGTGRVALISDEQVYRLHGERVKSLLEQMGLEVLALPFAAGETGKSLETLGWLLQQMAAAQLTRSNWVVALGGGVTGDVAGLAAGMFLRGVKLMHIPTTLLAMVDSSVGGKTAVNLPQGKNLAGMFYQPDHVICDISLLETLPELFWRDGMAEVIKYGMLEAPEIIQAVAAGTWKQQLVDLIERCVAIKRDMVIADERDVGLRKLLNLGHTVGHAIERCSDYAIHHGAAVAIGMVIVTRAAVRQGVCPAQTLEDLLTALQSVGLPTQAAYSAQMLA